MLVSWAQVTPQEAANVRGAGGPPRCRGGRVRLKRPALEFLTFVWDTLSVTRCSFDGFIYAQVMEKSHGSTASPERLVPLAPVGAHGHCDASVSERHPFTVPCWRVAFPGSVISSWVMDAHCSRYLVESV